MGKVPGDTEHSSTVLMGKQPALSTTVLVEDGENDLPEASLWPPGSISFSLLFCPMVWTLNQGMGVRRYEHSRCLAVPSKDRLFVAHSHSYAIVEPLWIINSMGLTLKQSMTFLETLVSR